MSAFKGKLIILTVFATLLLNSGISNAEWKGDLRYKPTKENLESREWFQDAKFGLFVHWGVYSVLKKGEWVMNNDKMSIAQYETLPPQFNPVNFDPEEWCKMAKDAGMKYITITSKHHDGFAMFDSKISGYDIVDRTPYGKDVLKMLSEACKRNGLKLYFYHSQLDWHHPDYYPLGRTGHSSGRPESGDWYGYIQYMNTQLKELLTNYGDIGGIWFDGEWDKPDADWHLAETYQLIHKLQPAAMIGSNHHHTPNAGEDFQMFEKGLPGKDPFSKDSSVSRLPLETCETMNNSWGYNESDKRFKSIKDLIHYLVKAAGNNANFLLNVGPMPDGTIQPEFKQHLAEMGTWLRANGESVYGTRGGPLAPQSWGVTTQTKDKVYLHVLADGDSVIAVPDLGRKINAITLLDGSKVEFQATPLGTVVKVPAIGRDAYDTVMVVK